MRWCYAERRRAALCWCEVLQNPPAPDAILCSLGTAADCCAAGFTFSETVAKGSDPADVAQALWLRSRGSTSDDPFHGPIYYPPELRLPPGA
jgi:hypothetical protein